MANHATIARPYAKALFEHALASEKLKEWSVILRICSGVVTDSNAEAFLNNPSTLPQQQTALLVELITELKIPGLSLKAELPAMTNVITLLAHNKRLFALSAISVLYDEMRAEQEKTLNVAVISFSALTKDQEGLLVNKLKHRLKREIELNVSIDETLLGGAIIQAGDLVIDGSVRGELTKLRASLVN
jgi:F-type H+-transporting ATPase subunit delta